MNLEEMNEILAPWVRAGRELGSNYGLIRLKINGGAGYFLPNYYSLQYKNNLYLDTTITAAQLQALAMFVAKCIGPRAYDTSDELRTWTGSSRRYYGAQIQLTDSNTSVLSYESGFLPFAALTTLDARVQQLVGATHD